MIEKHFSLRSEAGKAQTTVLTDSVPGENCPPRLPMATFSRWPRTAENETSGVSSSSQEDTGPIRL